MIRKMLKHQLPVERHEGILNFIRNQGKIPHHFTRSFTAKKHNDFLVYPVTFEEHEIVQDANNEDEDEAVLKIIKNLIAYIKHLEERK